MKMIDYYKSLAPIATAASVMGAAVLCVRELAVQSSLAVPLVLAVEVVTGILVYGCWIVFLDKAALRDICRAPA